MKPIVLFKDNNNKIVITADEIKQMIEDAYNDGYRDGSARYINVSSPIVTTPYYEKSPWWPQDHITITCETPTVTL